MAGEKYEELKKAVREYGDAAFENLLRCKTLGEAVIHGFHDYLGCDARCVSGVPAEGQFDPRRDYGDQAFSFSQREVIILEPVRFGISLIIGNTDDSGALWLRTVIAADMSGDHIEVFVAAQPVVRVPIEFEGELGPVHDAIFREFLDTFRLEVQEFSDSRFNTGIGFLPR